jgi:hypothetical protein
MEMRMREACSCGAQIEIEGAGINDSGKALGVWRTNHRHEAPVHIGPISLPPDAIPPEVLEQWMRDQEMGQE